MTRARSLSQLANSSVFTVATNNRVGIGSEVPTAKLDVDGTLNVSGNATIGGVATYEDVTNVDSVGIVTARSGVSVPDGQKIQLGNSNDLQIYHTGSHSLIDEVGTGNLTIRSSLISFEKYTNEQLARFTADGSCELFHDNSKKLETTSTGVSVTGSVSATVGSFSGNVTVNRTGSSQVILEGQLSGSQTSQILASGTATFASNILVGETTASSTNPGGYVYSTRYRANDDVGSAALNGVGASGKLSAFLAIDRSGNGEVASINYDGSASFAGGGFALDSDGHISTNAKFEGHIELDSTGSFSSPKIKLFANTGSATFAGSISSGFNGGTTNGVELVSTGYFNIRNDSASANVFSIYDGATVDANRTIGFKKDGSAAFAGAVDVGTFSSGTSGIRLTNTGTIYIGGTGNNAGLSIGNSAAVIDYDGSAAFAGTVDVGALDLSNTSAAGIEVRTTGEILIQRPSSQGTSSLIDGRLGSTQNVNILANGSATFANTIKSGGPTIIGGTNLGSQIGHEGNAAFCSGSTSSAIRVFKQGTSAATVDILGDGTAVFGNGFASGDGVNIFAGGSIYIRQDGATGGVLRIRNGSDYKIELNGNGTATFAGFVKSTNGNGSAFLGATSGTGIAINNSSNTTVTELNYDGSATFAGILLAKKTGESFRLEPTTGTSYMGFWNGTASAHYGFIGAASELVPSASTTDLAIRSQAQIIFASGGTQSRYRISSAGSHHFGANSNIDVIYSYATATGTSATCFRGGHSATAGNPGSGTDSFYVFANGVVQNPTGTIGQISDLKLKENIVDAPSQWDDIKAVRFRKFNFKEETGHETHTQLGVVAQELEQTSPGLIYETDDRNEDDVKNGEKTKNVKTSILTMKSLVALQEAMKRIETLEAEVAALKAG